MRTIADMEAFAYEDAMEAAKWLDKGKMVPAALALGRSAAIRETLGYRHQYTTLTAQEVSEMNETAIRVGSALGFRGV